MKLRERVSNFLSNESTFGRMMTRVYVLVMGNLLFLLFSIPLVTIGPALAGLYTVCLRSLRGDGDISPAKEFWKGFKGSFRLGILYWLGFLLFALLAYVDVRFSDAYGGVLTVFKMAILAIGFFVLITTTHFFPVVAAFSDTLGGTVRNAVFFAARNPLRSLLILVLHGLPVLVTVLDVRMRPLYVFLWACVGFSGIAMLCCLLLRKDFEKFLPKVDAWGNILSEEEKDEG